MKLAIATNNGHKLKEIREILGSFFDATFSLAELDINIDIEENGTTFLENALIKAKTISQICNMPTLADDSGLCVKALNNEPGVLSARYSNEHCDKKNTAKLLQNMDGILDRDAYFVSCIVLYMPSGKYIFENGYTHGKILQQEVGTNGFGYDPIFFSNDINKSFGVASAQEKNAISHRGRALHQLKKRLIANDGLIL